MQTCLESFPGLDTDMTQTPEISGSERLAAELKKSDATLVDGPVDGAVEANPAVSSNEAAQNDSSQGVEGDSAARSPLSGRSAEQTAKAARLASALRDNLRRRKAARPTPVKRDN